MKNREENGTDVDERLGAFMQGAFNSSKHILRGAAFATSTFLFLILAFVFSPNVGTAIAQGSGEKENAFSVEMKVQITGEAGSATFEKSCYNPGEAAVLVWSGARVENSNDLIIPTSITLNNYTIALEATDLIEIDKVQSQNLAYKQQMNEDATYTTYDDLLNYVTSEHRISIGKVTKSDVAFITFTRVSPVFRMYNKLTSEHLFSTNKAEYDNFVNLLSEGKDFWIGEGVDWLAPTSGDIVKRLYNPALGEMARSSHYYTSNETEIANLKNNFGWQEDPSDNWFVSATTTNESTIPIYTAYSEALGSSHHYTSSWDEWRSLDAGWDKEDAKNGLSSDGKSAKGVIAAVLSTNWKFTSNYYQVEHVLDANVVERQYVSGKAGDLAIAQAGLYPGYSQSRAAEEKTIAADNSTIVQVNYSANTYTIVYNEYGHGPKPNDNIKKFGEAISAPNKPSATGYVFGGWFYDRELNYPVNWTTMPATNMTVYAKWTEKATCVVTFDTQSHGNPTFTKEVANPSFLEEPLASEYGSATGYKLEGWYEDETFAGKQFDFQNTKITDDVVLYAKWTPIQYTINFMKGEQDVEGEMLSIDVNYDEYITLPECEFTKAGYKFAGWKYQGVVYQVGLTTLKNLVTRSGVGIQMDATWVEDTAQA